MSKLKLLAMVAGLAFAAALIAVASAQPAAYTPPPSPGATHPASSTFPPDKQLHASNGPFIGVEKAEQIALAVGDGHGTVVSAQFMTADQATASLGDSAVADNIGGDRQVWLVRVHGNYTPEFWNPTTGQPPTYDHYFVVIDATTAEILSTGSPLNQTW